jgi:hypothetical protein
VYLVVEGSIEDFMECGDATLLRPHRYFQTPVLPKRGNADNLSLYRATMCFVSWLNLEAGLKRSTRWVGTVCLMSVFIALFCGQASAYVITGKVKTPSELPASGATIYIQ